jgi:hypothetical protein
MYSKNKKFPFLFLWVLLFMGAALCPCPPPCPPGQEIKPLENVILIDRIAAVVNDEIITLTDIDKAIRFYPGFRKKQESEKQFYLRVLEELINHKVVYLEYRNELELHEEDYDPVQTPVIDKLGSLENLMLLLDTFDMDWPDFKEFIKEKVVYEKVINERLQVTISINFKEIEKFYHNEYLPAQEQMDLKPRSLIEMTAQIESHLKKVRIQQKLAEWLKEIRSSYKIENKLSKEK